MAFHTHAAILSTGDEIILGQMQDTNARWIAQRLADVGIKPVEVAAVGDDLDSLSAALARLAGRAPLVVMSGGLGPTDGDLTRAAVARVLGCEQVLDDGALAELSGKLAARGRAMTDRLKRQAYRPALASCLANGFGTAPGLHAVVRGAGAHGDTDVFCLPGPPGELRPMFEASVLPRLRVDSSAVVRTRLLQVIGIAESDAVERMGGLTKRDRMPLVGVTASGGQLTIRIRCEGLPEREADGAVQDAEASVRAALGDHVFAVGEATLAAAVVEALRAGGRTVAVAESCTGGLLGRLMTDVPGCSSVFAGGWITYSNAMKVAELGVSEAMLDQHGAVSEPVARALALGALGRSGATDAIAITGVAGPGGGSQAKPVGTVFVAHARAVGGTDHGPLAAASLGGPNGPTVDVRLLQIPGDREDVRNRAARSALGLLWFACCGRPPGEPRLLWENRVAA